MVIDYGHFFNTPKSAEFFVEVTFRGADTQPKDSEHAAWVRSLSVLISKKKSRRGPKYRHRQWEHAAGAWGAENASSLGKMGCGNQRCEGGCETENDPEEDRDSRRQWLELLLSQEGRCKRLSKDQLAELLVHCTADR